MKSQISEEAVYRHEDAFQLESGQVLPGFELVYASYGARTPGRPVVWVFHALTGSHRIEDWWPGLLAPAGELNPEKHRIICVNMPGSCYGSTGPASALPGEHVPRGLHFPELTVSDQIGMFDLLRSHLQIGAIDLAIGASMGGQLALQWAVEKPSLFRKLLLIATNAYHSGWGKAFNAAQRIAMEADPDFGSEISQSGQAGLKAARAIGMLSYRSYADFENKDSDPRGVEAYLRHAGAKLLSRFDATSYHLLTRTMDSHHCGRKLGIPAGDALARITAETTIVSLSSDMLFPPEEQEFLHRHIPGSALHSLRSNYGHDGFLVEYEKINEILKLKL